MVIELVHIRFVQMTFVLSVRSGYHDEVSPTWFSRSTELAKSHQSEYPPIRRFDFNECKGCLWRPKAMLQSNWVSTLFFASMSTSKHRPMAKCKSNWRPDPSRCSNSVADPRPSDSHRVLLEVRMYHSRIWLRAL